MPIFQQNKMPTITVNGEFSASTTEEADYLFAAMLFIKMAQKMSFGLSKNPPAWTPPPLLKFSAYGETCSEGGFLPVFITGYNFTYAPDVDYVPCSIANASVPVSMTIDVSLQVMYSPSQLRNAKLEAAMLGFSDYPNPTVTKIGGLDSGNLSKVPATVTQPAPPATSPPVDITNGSQNIPSNNASSGSRGNMSVSSNGSGEGGIY